MGGLAEGVTATGLDHWPQLHTHTDNMKPGSQARPCAGTTRKRMKSFLVGFIFYTRNCYRVGYPSVKTLWAKT